jgi:hypothetical protein
VWLLRGLPNNIKGEPTDFSAVAEPITDKVVKLHLGERVDTFEKYRRIRGLLHCMGFEYAQSIRPGGRKMYKLSQ